jgi:hypothetical protein
MGTSKESLKFTASRFHSNIMQHYIAPPCISYCLLAISLIQGCAIHITTIVFPSQGWLFPIWNTNLNTAAYRYLSINCTLCVRKQLNNRQLCIRVIRGNVYYCFPCIIFSVAQENKNPGIRSDGLYYIAI